MIAGDISTTAGLAGPVSISGDYLIAGGVNAVYFFQRSPIYGAWSQIRKIKESAEDTGNFGNSVSINGSNCVVGNPVWVNFAFTSSGRISFINIQ